MIDTQARAALTKVVEQIENLAVRSRQVLASNQPVDDVLRPLNELVVNAMLLTFTAGELYSLEGVAAQAQPVKVVPAKRVQTNYHNARDNRGRFISTVVTRVNP